MLEQQAKAPADLVSVVQFLRSSKSGMKIRVGALNGKRIDYFKGEWFVVYRFTSTKTDITLKARVP
jgi:hypothetical protein